MIPRNNFNGGDDYEPLMDALLFKPLPYQLAIREGAMHVVCFQSRPDGVDVTGKSSVFERRWCGGSSSASTALGARTST
jgi:hypothetical protein